MSRSRYDMLVLFRNESLTDREMEFEIQSLNFILKSVDHSYQFCLVHELVDRFYITSKPRKILRAIENEDLKPFRFLINKN